MATTKPLIVIVGETASGKSELAMQLAERFNGEIIAADSWTVRREVNIGTAKPSVADQKRAPHHLLNVVEPCADFTAAVFKDLATRAISEITKRGKLPIMVGGSGLYVDSVLYNYSFLPTGDRLQRRQWNNASTEQLVHEARIRGLATSHIDNRNKRRLIRLLETSGARPTKSRLRSQTLVVGLLVSREELKKRIEQRIDAMLAVGLEAEVKNLSAKYGWDCEALKGIGYREWQAFFGGQQTLSETRAKIIHATFDLAKKQRTWFKRNNSIQWTDDPRRSVEIVTTFLNKIK